MSMLQIIKDGENDKVEFKETFHVNIKTDKKDKGLKREVSRAVTGMLNSAGGLLLIGVANDGTIEGVSRDLSYYKASTKQENKDKMRIDIDNTLTNDLGIMAKRNLNISYEELEGKEIIKIKITSSPSPVYLNNVFYLRDGARTIQLNGSTLGEYILKRFRSPLNEKDSIQAFYNQLTFFLRNLSLGKLSNYDIKNIIQQLNNYDENVYFGIEIVQTLIVSNISFMNNRYKLKISHDLAGTQSNLKKKSKSIDIRNFTQVLVLLNDLHEFLMQNYGLEIHLPNNFPHCEVNLAIQYMQNIEITKHLELSIKNHSKDPLEISECGIDFGSKYIILDRKFVIKTMDRYISRPYPYALFKKHLKNNDIVKPYISRGYAKLNTGELFFSKKLKI